MKKFLSFLKNKYVIIGLIVVIIVIFFVVRSRSSAPSFQSTAAAVGNVIETVSVTGTVSPVGKASLAFEKSGVISHIDVVVGQSVKAGDPIAELDSATDEANLESAQATLSDMTASGNTSSASTAYTNATADAVNAFHERFHQSSRRSFQLYGHFF